MTKNPESSVNTQSKIVKLSYDDFKLVEGMADDFARKLRKRFKKREVKRKDNRPQFKFI